MKEERDKRRRIKGKLQEEGTEQISKRKENIMRKLKGEEKEEVIEATRRKDK